MREVTVYSRREIARIESAPGVVVVSIGDPPDGPVLGTVLADAEWPRGSDAKVPADARAVLRIKFWDVDPPRLRRRLEEWSRKAHPLSVPNAEGFVNRRIAAGMQIEHARTIWRFLRAHPEAGVFVHCEAGISRSAGVAAGLVATGGFRWTNQHEPWFRPNEHVKTLMAQAFRERPEPSAAGGV